MSMLENSSGPTSFNPPHLKGIHRHRPVLKRARTPYYPSEHSKRRRTSPTGAFSRLSLSPNAERSAPSRDQALDPTPSASSLTLHRRHSCLSRPEICPSPSYKDAKMGTRYSAYEPEPDRIIIESLSDRSNTPSPSLPTGEEPTDDAFELVPEIARQLSAREKEHIDRSTHTFLNSYHFLSSQPDPTPNDQQLVLYRRPVWPLIHTDSSDLPQIVEVDQFNNPIDPSYISSTSADLMDID